MKGGWVVDVALNVDGEGVLLALPTESKLL